MIKKLKRVIGSIAGTPKASKLPSVIGEVDQSNSGNTILRIGEMISRDPATGHGNWTQTEHVALTPEERDELIDVLSSQQEYKTVKLGDVIAVGRTVLAVQYVNGTGDLTEKIGTALTWDGKEYAVFALNALGEAHYGTYTPDSQRALNAYITRVNEHLFQHFNATPPTLTYAHVADRDKLTGGK